MNLVFMETLYSCQNSFCNPQNMPLWHHNACNPQNIPFWHHNACNPQNMPYWHHNATVGTTWLTNVWLVKSHRHKQTCQNIQFPVRMLTAVVTKCGPWWQKLKHSAADDGMIKTACSFGMNHCDFFCTFVGADSCNVGSLIYSYLSSLNTQWTCPCRQKIHFVGHISTDLAHQVA